LKKNSNRFLVGSFTVGAIVVLIGFAVFTGGFSSFRNQNERFVLVFHENMYGLYEGGKVTLNGVRIGRVERFFLGDAIEDAPVPVLVEINRKLVHRHMVDTGNEIFDSEGKFKKDIVKTLVGQLIQESFVTGILYINLTTDNGQSGEIQSEINELYGYPELKTKDSIFAELSEKINFEKMSTQVSKLLEVATIRLDELDFGTLQSDFAKSNQTLRKFLDTFSENYSSLGPNLSEASTQAAQTMKDISSLSKTLNLMVQPDSELRFQFSDTLRDVSLTSKSLKRLAELLERNPQAFLIGKPSNSKE
jgi:ABC-type transporter Mla subunit MlaD